MFPCKEQPIFAQLAASPVPKTPWGLDAWEKLLWQQSLLQSSQRNRGAQQRYLKPAKIKTWRFQAQCQLQWLLRTSVKGPWGGKGHWRAKRGLFSSHVSMSLGKQPRAGECHLAGSASQHAAQRSSSVTFPPRRSLQNSSFPICCSPVWGTVLGAGCHGLHGSGIWAVRLRCSWFLVQSFGEPSKVPDALLCSPPVRQQVRAAPVHGDPQGCMPPTRASLAGQHGRVAGALAGLPSLPGVPIHPPEGGTKPPSCSGRLW